RRAQPPAPGPSISGDEAVAGRAVREGAAVASSDILADPRLTLGAEMRERIRRAGHGSVLAVPLRIGGRITGVLAVGDVTGRTFREEEIRRLQDFGNQAAIALENARLFALETSRREQLENLSAVQRDVSAELELDRVLAMIVYRARGAGPRPAAPHDRRARGSLVRWAVLRVSGQRGEPGPRPSGLEPDRAGQRGAVSPGGRVGGELRGGAAGTPAQRRTAR